MDQEKIRAERNRTLTLTEQERKQFKENLCSVKSLKDGVGFMNRTINADIMEVLPLLPNHFADLIIIDPPYNLSKDFSGLKFNAMKEEDYEAYIESWFPQVCDKLKPNGTLYMCGDWKCTSSLQRVISKYLTVINRITWQREKGRGAQTNWKNAMEDIWYTVSNPKDYYFNVDAVKVKRKVIAPYKENGKPKDWEESSEGNYRITYPSNFWDDISIPFWSMPENTDHPTQKAEKLYAKLVLASSKPGDVVFDPFLGSGTASVVAKKLGRNFCGVEINEEYCCYAEKRLLMADTDKNIQGYFDGIFWERNTLNEQKLSVKKDNQSTTVDHSISKQGRKPKTKQITESLTLFD